MTLKKNRAKDYFEAVRQACQDKSAAIAALSRMKNAEQPKNQRYQQTVQGGSAKDPMDATCRRIDYEEGDFKTTITECDRIIDDAKMVVAGIRRTMGESYSAPLLRYYVWGETLQSIASSYMPKVSRQTVRRHMDEALEQVDIVGVSAMKDMSAPDALDA